MPKRVPLSELRFDLQSVRDVKRLANRLVKRLTMIERGMLRFKQAETKRKAESRRRRQAEAHPVTFTEPPDRPEPLEP